ncbi:hypothetical protein CC86DRAFT_367874 [Ophiobolus disseminans]|uniref:Uncharacterized protein n=1 Tax=Ophiobolus disseminans TaxID=1469910 RepID=A0A6A7ABA4_9PLEO|nr:hypothetical protein CC86DRAFT_367874 [Ophiobolus disseminans]
MDGAQSPKGKAVRVAQADQDQINRLHTQVLEQRNRLKRAREQVAEDEEALQVVSRRKNVMELQLHHQKYSIRSLET